VTTSPVGRIVEDPSLGVLEKEDRLAAELRRLPGLGAEEALGAVVSGGPAGAARFAADYLAVLPDHLDEKRQAVEHVLRHRPDELDDVGYLVRFLEREMADELVRHCLEDQEERGGALFAAAEAFPDVVRAHEERIQDPDIRVRLWPGAPKQWLVVALLAWRNERDLVAVEQLSFARTDEAREALLRLGDEMPDDAQDLYETLVENAGVFPDTRSPSVYPRTLMGLVGEREVSRHHMGAGYGPSVPLCPLCQRPGVRVLTLAREDLPFEVGGTADPSLFWLPCDCDAVEYLYVRFTDQGLEGLVGEVGPPDDGEDWLPGRLALELLDHPNQHGRSTDAIPGQSDHQVGGYPPWVQTERFPRCPDCHQGMRNLASIDSGKSAFGRMPFEGMLFGFWCDRDSISVTFVQRL
jgi:hypothetical protein